MVSTIISVVLYTISLLTSYYKMNVVEKINLNRSRAKRLRTILTDDLYFTTTNSYKETLSDLLRKLHMTISSFKKRNADKPEYHTPRDLSKRQYEVIDNAISNYNEWLVKDSSNPDFISSRSQQMSLVDKLNTRFYDVYRRVKDRQDLEVPDGSEFYGKTLTETPTHIISSNSIERIPQQVIPLVKSLKEQLFKRKMLLTKKQKIYCNKLFKEINELEINYLKEIG